MTTTTYPAQPVWYPAPEKSLAIAYLLWFFLGLFGVHHFYLGKIGRGVGYFFTAAWFTIGFWVALFTLPSQVHTINARRHAAAWGRAGWVQQPTVQHVTTLPQSHAVPAGWYVDPTASSQWRYWDGSAWTQHVADRRGSRGSSSVGMDPPVG